MATAKQKKQAPGKKKPNAKSAVKSAPKGTLPKKNSALKTNSKPQKETVKATPAKKVATKSVSKPVKKVTAAPVKAKAKPTKSNPVTNQKAAPAPKAPAPSSKSSPASVKKPAANAGLKKNSSSPASPASKVKNPSAPSHKTVKSVGTPPAKTTPAPVVKGNQQKPQVKTAPSKPAPVQKPLPGKKTDQKTNAKPSVKPVSSKSVPGDKKAKGDTPEPLQIKAEKAIREMEETMDLSKLRPRIQAGSSAPKPLIKHHQLPLPKLPEPTNTAKVKFQLEFEFRSSPKILFTSLSDSSGLAGWFADEVHTKDDIYTFSWEGGDSQAKLVAVRDLQLVRFQWLEDIADGTYFQFEIKEDDITSDVALVITDFALPGEKETNIRLWESQVQKLRMLLGSL